VWITTGFWGQYAQSVDNFWLFTQMSNFTERSIDVPRKFRANSQGCASSSPQVAGPTLLPVIGCGVGHG